MKIRKLMAALLCAAMTVTSPCIEAMASTDIIDVTDTVDIVEPAEEVSDIVSDDPADDVVAPVSEDIISTEADVVDEEGPEAPSEEILDEEAEHVKYPASGCFDPDSTTLKMAAGYEGKKVSDYTDAPVIPKKVETIPAEFFKGDTGIRLVYFEDGSVLTSIGEGAFENSGITYFQTPKGYTTVEANTFKNCTSLNSFGFNNISTIGESAFEGCSSLGTDMTLITGGSKVSDIGDRAFANCSGFVNLALAERFTATTINVGDAVFAGCMNLTTAVVPDGFLSVPDSCFKGCEKLTSVTLGKKAASIGDSAFENCKKLTSVKFYTTTEDTSKVISVGDYAFKTCPALKTITFPRACVTFGDYLFQGCSSLTDVYFTCRDDDNLATEFEIGDNAFSGISAVTVHGYDGLVLDYCTTRTIKYASMNTGFNVELGNIECAYGTCKIGGMDKPGKPRNNVPVGSKVYFTVYPKKYGVNDSKTYILVDSLKDANDSGLKIQYYGGPAKQPVFCFDMPAHNVKINGEYIKEELFAGLNLKYSIGAYNEELLYQQNGKNSYNKTVEDSYNYVTEKTGNRGLLNVGLKGQVNGVSYEYNLGVWNLSFIPGNTSVVTVDNTGLVTAKGAGTTTITAGVTGRGKSVKFDVTVQKSVEFESIEFDDVEFINHSGKNPADAYVSSEGFYYDEEFDREQFPYIINYLKTELTQDRRFKISFSAYDETGGEIFIPASWSVTNTNIATLANSTTNDNYNIVTVKKGATGTVTIKASYNTGKKYQDDKHKGKPIIRSAYAILNITDPAPTTANSLRINKQKNLKEKGTDGKFLPESQQNYGALIPIVANPDYPFSSIYGSLYYLDKSTNTYKINYGVKIVETGIVKDGIPQYRLYVTDGDSKINELALKKELTYTGNNKLYIRGSFEDDEMGDFYIPIENLVIFNEMPQPKLVKTGVINTFYNSTCYDISSVDYIGWDDIMGKNTKKTPENIDRYAALTIGTTYLSQSYNKASAEVDYERSMILDDNNYARYSVNKDVTKIVDTALKPDPLRNNYVLLPDPNSENNFIIRRTNKDMMTNDSGSEVNSGYIFIYYKGYKDPFISKLKIDVKSAPPAYTMTQTSATASVLSGATSFKFKYLSKKTNEAAFVYDDVDKFITKQDLSTQGVFSDPTSGSDDFWNLPMNSKKAGKKVAVMELKLRNWSKAQNYTFTVNVTDAVATAKLSRTAVNLNKNMTGDPADAQTTLVLSHSDAVPVIDDIVFAGAQKLYDESDKLEFEVNPSADYPNQCVISVRISDDSIQKGTYRFRILPSAEYASGSKPALKEVYLNVSVADTLPTLKLNTTSVTFNLDYPNQETQKLRVTGVSGLPAGIAGAEVKEGDEGMLIEKDDMQLTFAGNTKNPTLVQDAQCVLDALEWDLVKKQDEKTKKWYYMFTCKMGDLGTDFSAKAFNMPFTVTGIKINGAPIKPFKFVIKSTRATPLIQVKTSEGINSVDPYSRYKLTLTVKNLVNPEINSLNIKAFDNDGNDYVDDDQFTAEKDDDDDKIWYLYANHDNDDDPEGRFRIGKHEIFLEYTLAGVTFNYIKLNLTPQQVLPRLSQDVGKAVFFYNAENRTCTYKLTKTSVLRSHISEGNIIISDSNPYELKNAFEVSYEDIDTDETARKDMKTTLKSWDAGMITLNCTKPSQLQAGKTYTLKLEVVMDGQFYKRDNKGKLILDSNDDPVLTQGQIISVPVIVQR